MTRASPSSPHSAVTPPATGDLALAYAAATAVAAAGAWIMLQAVHAAAGADVRGTVEPLVLLTRIGVLVTPVTVAVRVASYTALVWLTLTALGERPQFRGVAFRLLLLAPILDAPAILDCLSFLLRDLASLREAHIPIGLDLLFPGRSGRLALLLHNLNAATVTWGAGLAWILRRTFGHTRLAATLAAGTATSAVVLLPLLAT